MSALVTPLSYAQVRDRLDEIDTDLADRQPIYEAACSDYFRAKRNYEAAYAREYVRADGKNSEERKSRALLALMPSQEYKGLIVAEAAYEAGKAAMRTLETRASIGQSLLRVTAQERGG